MKKHLEAAINPAMIVVGAVLLLQLRHDQWKRLVKGGANAK